MLIPYHIYIYVFVIITTHENINLYYYTRHTFYFFLKIKKNKIFIRKGSSYDYENFFKYKDTRTNKNSTQNNEFSFFKKFITYLFHQLLLYCNIFIAISYGNSLYNFNQFIIFDWIKIQCNNIN